VFVIHKDSLKIIQHHRVDVMYIDIKDTEGSSIIIWVVDAIVVERKDISRENAPRELLIIMRDRGSRKKSTIVCHFVQTYQTSPI